MFVVQEVVAVGEVLRHLDGRLDSPHESVDAGLAVEHHRAVILGPGVPSSILVLCTRLKDISVSKGILSSILVLS